MILNMHMKRTKQILTGNENISVSEVTHMVGFTDPTYFSKCFKDYYGVLPSEFL